MRIVINAWFWNSPTAGSGQYTRQLVEGLVALDAGLQVVLVIPTERKQDAGGERRPILHPASCSRSNLGKIWFEQVAFPLCWPKNTSVLGPAKMDVEPLVSDGGESGEWVGSATQSRSYPLNPDSWRPIEETFEMIGAGNWHQTTHIWRTQSIRSVERRYRSWVVYPLC